MSNPVRVLVTGGAGFIGSHLVDRLLAGGYRVRVLDNLSNGSLDRLGSALAAGAELELGDVLDADICRRVTESIDVVYHLACLGVRHSLHAPVENLRVNTMGAARVFEAARSAGVRRVVYVSSSEVYGGTTAVPQSAGATPPAPLTPYAAGKLAGEHVARAYASTFGLDAVVLRLFNTYGPRSHHEGDAGELIPRTITRLLTGQPPVVFGDGGASRDLVYVEDMAEALARALEIRALSGQTLDVGSGVELSVREIVARLQELTDTGGRVPLRLPARPGDTQRLRADPNPFARATGFVPRTDLDDGLRRTVAYFRDLNARGLLDVMPPLTNWGEDGGGR